MVHDRTAIGVGLVDRLEDVLVALDHRHARHSTRVSKRAPGANVSSFSGIRLQRKDYTDDPRYGWLTMPAHNTTIPRKCMARKATAACRR